METHKEKNPIVSLLVNYFKEEFSNSNIKTEIIKPILLYLLFYIIPFVIIFVLINFITTFAGIFIFFKYFKPS